MIALALDIVTESLNNCGDLGNREFSLTGILDIEIYRICKVVILDDLIAHLSLTLSCFNSCSIAVPVSTCIYTKSLSLLNISLEIRILLGNDLAVTCSDYGEIYSCVLYLLPVYLMLPFRHVDTIGSAVEIS